MRCGHVGLWKVKHEFVQHDRKDYHLNHGDRGEGEGVFANLYVLEVEGPGSIPIILRSGTPQGDGDNNANGKDDNGVKEGGQCTVYETSLLKFSVSRLP